MIHQPLGVARAAAFQLTLLCFTLGTLPIFGQSDPSNFATIINAPDAIIGDSQSIGSNTQLNIFDGADIGRNLGGGDFQSTNIEINVFGGVVPDINSISRGVTANVSGGLVGTADPNEFGGSGSNGRVFGPGIRSAFGAPVNVSGGTIQGDSRLSGGAIAITGGTFLGPVNAFGSDLSVSGGIFTDNFSVSLGGSLTLAAGDVRLNGEAFDGNTLSSFSNRDVLSGTFADGSGFIFSYEDSDRLLDGTRIQAVALPAPDLQPIAISQTDDATPQNLRTGQTLTLSNNGALGVGFTAAGSTVSIEGGNVGDSFEASEALVTVTGGNIGERFNVFAGSDVNITGGSFGRNFLAGENSDVRISGGSFGDRFVSRGDSTTFVGGDFLLNGSALIDSSSVTFNSREPNVFTATLADGTVAIFALKPDVQPRTPSSSPSLQFSSDILLNVNLETSTLPEADLSPIVLDANSSSQPRGLRSGQSLTVLDGGSLDRNFAAVNSTVDVQGGSVGDNFEVADAEVTLSAGSVGDRFNVFQNSHVTISSGSIGDHFYAGNNSHVSVLGGEIGDDVDIAGGSTIDINGGVVGDNFEAAEGTTVDVRNGSVGNNAFVGGTLNLSGGQIGDELNATGSIAISGGAVGANATFTGASEISISGGTIGSGATFSGDQEVSVSGGSVEDGLTLVNNVRVVVSGDGVLGNDVSFEDGGSIDINGGSVGNGLEVSRLFGFDNPVVNLFDGSIGDRLFIGSGGIFNIYGGSVGEEFVVSANGTANIFGGSIPESFAAFPNSTVNLFVNEAILDGVALDLFENVPFEFADLTAPLDAILSDGSAFRFDNANVFSGATINLIRVSAIPEPASWLLGVSLLLVATGRRRKRTRVQA